MFPTQPVGTFYYLCSVLDGYSRSIVHWDLRESMKEAEIEVILERAKGSTGAKPGSSRTTGQFMAVTSGVYSDLRMTHVRTSPFIRSRMENGKMAQNLQTDAFAAYAADRGGCATLDHRATWSATNTVRLTGIGYVTPQSMLAEDRRDSCGARS